MWTVRVSSLEPRDVYGALRSSPRGLSADEVRLRRAEAGPNSLPLTKPRSVLRELAAQFADQVVDKVEVALPERVGVLRHGCQATAGHDTVRIFRPPPSSPRTAH